jgi:hypothetical protein
MLRRRLYPLLLVGLLSLAAAGEVRAQTVRWDIISTPSFNPLTVMPGGVASALGGDGSEISVTGSGTFVVEKPTMVTGGGVWLTRSPLGSVTGFGTYTVTSVVAFTEAPGALPANTIDNIGKLEQTRAGVAVLGITYSDGSKGTLIIN